MLPAEHGPFEHGILTGALFQGLEIAKIRLAGRDDDCDRPNNGNARDQENQNQYSALFLRGDAQPSFSSQPAGHHSKLRAVSNFFLGIFDERALS